ncbi:MAG: flagellar biosynthetic protein FliO [Spirochaetia bacterium]|nr:flagellar biosynthetic protein FliO [Spirochaetia bacterium]
MPVVSGQAPQENTAGEGYLAKEIKDVQVPRAVPAPTLMSTVINLVLSLLFVIGLIYLVTLAIKFFYVKASVPARSESVVKVLAKEYLDSKTILYMVEFGGSILLLGQAGESIAKITEVTDPAAAEKLKQQADEYISKYRLKSESRFDRQLKSVYVSQGKKLVDSGNQAIKSMMDKFKKKDTK